MEITLSMAGHVPILHLSGRLDASTSPILEERLLPLIGGECVRIVFDCSCLTYVSSAGLRVFLNTQRNLSSSSGGVAFAALSSPVLELFTLAGLESLFAIESSVEIAAGRLN
jgi:anti-anti-sigma factor